MAVAAHEPLDELVLGAGLIAAEVEVGDQLEVIVDRWHGRKARGPARGRTAGPLWFGRTPMVPHALRWNRQARRAYCPLPRAELGASSGAK